MTVEREIPHQVRNDEEETTPENTGLPLRYENKSQAVKGI